MGLNFAIHRLGVSLSRTSRNRLLERVGVSTCRNPESLKCPTALLQAQASCLSEKRVLFSDL